MVVFSYKVVCMNLYIYSDESGVFDKTHYDYFVFAGIIIAGNDDKEMWSRKYAAAERSVNVGGKYGNRELKASKISVKDRNKLFRSLNQCHKFAVVIHQDELMDKLYEIKKEKQRYLDYIYKMIVEEAIYDLNGRRLPNDAPMHKGIYIIKGKNKTKKVIR